MNVGIQQHDPILQERSSVPGVCEVPCFFWHITDSSQTIGSSDGEAMIGYMIIIIVFGGVGFSALRKRLGLQMLWFYVMKVIAVTHIFRTRFVKTSTIPECPGISTTLVIHPSPGTFGNSVSCALLGLRWRETYECRLCLIDDTHR